MATEMLQKRGTAAEWAAANPILDAGEIGFETDTKVLKVGDGVTPWTGITMPYLSASLFDAKGDLLVGNADNQYVRLPRGIAGQRLTVQADGSLAWQTSSSISPTLVDAKGDLLVGSADDTVARLARGTTGQRLTVQADGSLAWTNMPDLSVYETTSHAASTYETASHAASTYETAAHALATYAPKRLYVAKAADTGRANTAALANDPDLALAVVVNSVYIFEAVLFYTGDPVADFQIGMNGPAGSSLSWFAAGPDVSMASGVPNADGQWRARVNVAPLAAATSFGASSSSGTVGLHIHGRISVGATAGNLAIAWAQNVATAGQTTTVLASSYLLATKVA